MTDNRKVVILGGGAVGSSFAAALCKVPGIDVTLTGRKAHIDLINSDGLKLTGKFEDTFMFKGNESINYSLDNTLLLVTVKSVDLEKSLKEINEFILPSTTVLLTQNGWGIREIAEKSLKNNNNIYCGIVGMGATWTTPGAVQCWGGNLLVEKAFAKTSWSGIFDNIFLDYSSTDNINKAIWRKLIINSIVNPLSVILNAKNYEVADEASNSIKKSLLQEALEVSEAWGITINLTIDKFNSFIKSPNYTSMYQDIKRGRNTEIGFINGALIKLGAEKEIDTPTHKLITQLIEAREELNRKQV